MTTCRTLDLRARTWSAEELLRRELKKRETVWRKQEERETSKNA